MICRKSVSDKCEVTEVFAEREIGKGVLLRDETLGGSVEEVCVLRDTSLNYIYAIDERSWCYNVCRQWPCWHSTTVLYYV